MSGPSSAPQPLPGRSCGECTACCVELEIDDPELHKPDETACPHLLAKGGCGIYATRPKTCANWYCGWRLINVSDALRPDRSKVLMIPELCHEPGYQKGGLRLVPTGGDLQVLLQGEIVDLAGRFVASGVPMYLSYGSGAQCQRVLINDLGKAAVGAGDRAGFLRMLQDVLRQLSDRVQAAARAQPPVPPAAPQPPHG